MESDNTNRLSLILASQSPRRKELLGWVGIPFEQFPVDILEKSSLTSPQEVAEDIAVQKGDEAYRQLRSREGFGKTFFPCVVSSDTIVCLDTKIMGKPGDVNEARAMLKELAGRLHTVVTGVYIILVDPRDGKEKSVVFSSTTDVEFDQISEDVLEEYLQTGDSLDKAGSYGIQGPSLTFIKSVHGSYSNVVGFPLNEFIKELKALLTSSRDDKGEWRNLFHD
ncbi:MAG: septum formation protein Maf [Deltaproteobacteria bacterium]|nr:MAG: septum formation protein Maf [Deltaproteobacteria bacterium]TNF28758.1 MAG: septum formation protein Maf [Deltaproteobacteria bacterium]